MRGLMNALMLHCKKATFLIEKSNDTPLPFFEKVQLNMHLSICNGCRNYLQQNRFIEQLLQQHANATLIPTIDTSDLEVRILSQLN